MLGRMHKLLNYQRKASSPYRGHPLRNYTNLHPKMKNYQKYLDTYWDEKGKVKLRHMFNRFRVPLVYNSFSPGDSAHIDGLVPSDEFRKIKILDVGCGGGICSESLAMLNFDVTGIDPNPDLINIAETHKRNNRALDGKSLQYFNVNIDEFSKIQSGIYDGVVINEVLEYVPGNAKLKFIEDCVRCCKIDGSMFATSLKCDWSALFHTLALWITFEMLLIRFSGSMSPSLLKRFFEINGCRIMNVRGITFDHFDEQFVGSDYAGPWYFIHAVKQGLIDDKI